MQRKIVARALLAKSSMALGIISIFLAGCFSSVHRNELIGTYVADYGFGREELKLAPDGSYTQNFVPKNQSLKPASNSGKWEFDGKYLRLRDSLVVLDQLGDGLSPTYGTSKSGDSVLPVRSSFGRVLIQLSANADMQYRKSGG